MVKPANARVQPQRLRVARVLRVVEGACELWTEGQQVSASFAPQFPGPHQERVSPGHLVAVATGPSGDEVVVWRWYDAVVLEPDSEHGVLLWEPAHGEVMASARPSYQDVTPGSRAYASAGLPGADWWVAGPVDDHPDNARVELDAVEQLYTDHALWEATFHS